MNKYTVLSLNDLMVEVIGAMTKHINKKRINEVVNNFIDDGGNDGLNSLLVAYYNNGDDYEEEEITREDPELAELLDEYI